MRHIGRFIVLIASLAAITAVLWPDTAFAQRGRPPATQGRPPAPAHRPRAVNRERVVFVGGYFYDPFFGRYPWWSPSSYPYLYYPQYYDDRAVVRIKGEPDKTADDAAVYVDGFYAGVVEDFDGFFEGLPLSPGAHEIGLYLNGYRTVRKNVYLSPASSVTMDYTPERLPPGVASEPPVLAAPIPPPPEGTFIPPATERPAPTDAPRQTATTGLAQGTLLLRVQPADAELRIDGEVWTSSGEGRFAVQVPAGTHRIEVVRSGYRTYSADVQVRHDERSPVNVTLMPERP